MSHHVILVYFVCLLVYLSLFCLAVDLSICLSVYLSICLCVRLSVRLSVLFKVKGQFRVMDRSKDDAELASITADHELYQNQEKGERQALEFYHQEVETDRQTDRQTQH